jgi:predicted DNA repair protein MutK
MRGEVSRVATSLLALIDDIATVLDDVAVLTKVAAKKTAGVLGDDLALNAQQVAGVAANRELPVVWAVAKGSAVNKLILVPVALAISQLAPWLVTPLLMFGGVFLCFEGVEKLAHKFLHPEEADADRAQLREALLDPSIDLVALEKEKIKGAIRTDFVLSAEIIAITLGAAAGAPFMTRLAVLAGISALMTVGVYGFVAGIVKIDDAGIYLNGKSGDGGFTQMQRGLGKLLLLGAPVLMKLLSIAGTAAMFLVGGGILTHGIPAVHHAIEHVATQTKELPGGEVLSVIVPLVGDGITGVIAGALALGAVTVFQRVRG